MIGSICLWNFSDINIAEVGYDLNPTFQKQGIMSEALKSVIDFGFNELKLEKIEAFTHTENVNSKKLLTTNGFKHIFKRKDEGNSLNDIFVITKTKTC